MDERDGWALGEGNGEVDGGGGSLDVGRRRPGEGWVCVRQPRYQAEEVGAVPKQVVGDVEDRVTESDSAGFEVDCATGEKGDEPRA